MKKGIIVRSGCALGFPNAIRITVGSEEQNQAVLMELENFITEKQNKLTK